MSDFFAAVGQYRFLQYALLAGVLVSVAGGVVGAYVAVRRIGYIAGGIAHCVLAGLGAANYLNKVHGWTWLHPLHGAVAAALAAAVIIGLVSLRAREREDTAIGAVWALGMAIGLLFIARTPGYSQDLMWFLFGNILIVSPADLWLIAALDVVVIGAGLLFYHPFQAMCFDEEFARTRGVPVEWLFILMLCLTALTVVLLVTVVGIVMVIALLSLPVAVAGRFARSLWQIMLLSAVFTVLFTAGGLALSYGPDLPTGPVIIVLSGAVYALVLCASWLRRKLAPARRSMNAS